jgi:lactate dehydrogenase-like 2-hydroxyacid dehydrogenase
MRAATRYLEADSRHGEGALVGRGVDDGCPNGSVAAGRIGLAVLRRLKPFDMHLHYYERHRLPDAVENELGLGERRRPRNGARPVG